MELILTRFAQGLGGTFGALVHGSIPIVNTIELPWLDNKRGVSCIPAQHYTVKRMPAAANPKHGVCFEVQDVPGRTDILFHSANTILDIKGCIGVALYFGTMRKLPALLNYPVGKGEGLKVMMRYLKGIDEFDLEIRNCWL